VDRVLGALFGALRGCLLLLLATAVVSTTPLKSSAAWQESFAVAWAVSALKTIKPVLPCDLQKYLPG
jgi:membrane protein required for colicin V production